MGTQFPSVSEQSVRKSAAMLLRTLSHQQHWTVSGAAMIPCDVASTVSYLAGSC